ncbi:hypothetical protein SUDANB6_00046 [Streptomyces sp. enrichment culture]|uniref:hypothetical protein n=1 Tax=Streptomyces sp. enrichment culture TaxID=1795815 RepID=UPI003F5538F8
MTAVPGPGLFRPAAVTAAALSAVVHVALLGTHTGATAVLTLVLALACLGCSVMLSRSSRPREWIVMAVLGTAMLALHGLGTVIDSMPMTHHTSEGATHGQGYGTVLMYVASGLAVTEVAFALTGLLTGTGLRADGGRGQPLSQVTSR